MNLQHTPGPWRIRFLHPNDSESEFFVEANNNRKPELGYGIEVMGDDYGDHNGYPRTQRLADAKLIAASPEMLQLLKEQDGYYRKHYESGILTNMAHNQWNKIKNLLGKIEE